DLAENVNGVQDVQNELRVMAQGIAPELSAEFTRSSASSARSQNVGSRDRSSAKSSKSSQSSSRRMNS
ncbi:MAG: hypothetical protein ACAH59_01780, partial [Pseudobdellovibrionaceae bacterium]